MASQQSNSSLKHSVKLRYRLRVSSPSFQSLQTLSSLFMQRDTVILNHVWFALRAPFTPSKEIFPTLWQQSGKGPHVGHISYGQASTLNRLTSLTAFRSLCCVYGPNIAQNMCKIKLNKYVGGKNRPNKQWTDEQPQIHLRISRNSCKGRRVALTCFEVTSRRHLPVILSASRWQTVA